MYPKELAKEHLAGTRLMQLSTTVNDEPWACTVHFYSDDDFNLYWMSAPDRNHSQHIKQNPKVAVAIMVHEDTPDEKYVIGVSMTGTAEFIGETISESALKGYISKLKKSHNLLNEMKSGENPNKFYKFTPDKVVLFDTKNFKDNPRLKLEI